MRAPPEVRIEIFRKIIDRISYELEKGTIIVVEGVRDRESLQKIGIAGRILCLQSSRKNLVGFVEELDEVRNVLVLTDFDRQGVFLAKRLARILTAQGIRTNLVIWRNLRSLTRSDVRSIEELPKFYRRLEEESSSFSQTLDSGYEVPAMSNHRKSRRTMARTWT